MPYTVVVRRYHYILTLSFVFVIPTIIASVVLSDEIYLGALLPFIVLVTIIGSIWDIWATRHGKKDRVWLWQFNGRQTLGIRLFGLPVEEYLFYVASSVYVVFMWEGFKLMLERSSFQVYQVIGSLAAWTIVSICVPYVFRKRGDKLIG